MWSEGNIENLAVAIEAVQCDSGLTVIDHANVGDLCQWLTREFAQVRTHYSNQHPTRKQDQTVFSAARDEWYGERVKGLDQRQCRPMSLPANRLIDRLGGRRFDFVISRHQFENDSEAAKWWLQWVPVTTGEILFVSGGEFCRMPGDHPVPERSPPVSHPDITDEAGVASLDVNHHPLYERKTGLRRD